MGRTTPHALIKSLEATTAITNRRFVKYGAADGTGVPAVDGAAYIVGVNAELDVAIGERASVICDNAIADIEYGGNVTRGDPLTADAQGRAVTAAPAAGANAFIGGWAEVSGVLGDIGSINVRPTRIQG
jgi:hypothetical protein